MKIHDYMEVGAKIYTPCLPENTSPNGGSEKPIMMRKRRDASRIKSQQNWGKKASGGINAFPYRIPTTCRSQDGFGDLARPEFEKEGKGKAQVLPADMMKAYVFTCCLILLAF